MSARRLRSIQAIAVLAFAGLNGCASGGSERPVARVAGTSITLSNVEHWMAIVSVGGGNSGRRPRLMETLGRLVEWRWLIAEASERGQHATRLEIRRRLRASERAEFPGGAEELDVYLKASGQTNSDLELEAEAELARAGLRADVLSHLRPATGTEIATYYERHLQDYAVDEQRKVTITNRKTYAAAERAKRQVEAGGSFAGALFDTEIRHQPRNLDETGRPVLERAIRRAALNVLTGPVRQPVSSPSNDYFVFVVKRITPATHRTLEQERTAIARLLARERRRRALAAFVRAWWTKWSARTDCRAGYVIPECKQARGSVPTRAALESFSL